MTRLQEVNDLKATGTVGPATWKVLLAAEGVIELPDEGAPATAAHVDASRPRPRASAGAAHPGAGRRQPARC